MARIERDSTRVATAETGSPTLVELLSRHLEVMRLAQVAGVLVRIAAAQLERFNVVNPGGLGDLASSETHLAKAVGAAQTAQALCLPCSAPEPLNLQVVSPARPER